MLNTKNTNNADHRLLKLYQLNTTKSLTVHSCLLHQIHQDNDMILIQEPYISKQGKSRATQGWITMYPTGHNQDLSQTRAIMLVNWAVSTNSWSSVPLNSQDAVAINLWAPAESVIIVNIYSDRGSIAIWKTIDKLFREYVAKWHDEAYHIDSSMQETSMHITCCGINHTTLTSSQTKLWHMQNTYCD